MSYGQGRQQGQQKAMPAGKWAMGRAGDRVSSKQGPRGMSYGQGRRQGQQQAGQTGNELWAGPVTGSATYRAIKKKAMGRASDRWAMGRAGNKQGWWWDQQQTGPATCRACDSNRRASNEVGYGQGWQHAGPAARLAKDRAGCRDSNTRPAICRTSSRTINKWACHRVNNGQGQQQHVTSRFVSRQDPTAASWAAREQASSNAYFKQMR